MDTNHASAEIAPGVRLHYVSAGSRAGTIVLLHGFPQTSHEWRKVDAGARCSGLSRRVP